MREIRIWRTLEDCKAIIEGHFVFASAWHGDIFLDKDAVSKYPKICAGLSWHIAQEVGEKIKDVDMVVGPAAGAIVLANRVAEHLTDFYLKEKEVISVYTEKASDGSQCLNRGFDKDVKGEKVLVIDDILTTGRSVEEVIRAVKDAGGKVVGVAILVARHQVASDRFGVPLVILLQVELASWPEEDCPLCKEGAPINTGHGHGREFLEKEKEK